MNTTNTTETENNVPQGITFFGLTSGGCAGVATALITLVPDGQATAAAAVFALAALVLAVAPLLHGHSS